MSQPNHPTSFGYKREEFRKQIRREKLNQQFASRRKILFQNSYAFAKSNKNQVIQLNSWEEVHQQLDAFTPDYCAIHLYIDKNQVKEIPQEIHQKLISLANRPEFLTNENALCLLVTLTDLNNHEGRSIFEPDTVQQIIDCLIKSNLVKVQINGQIEERIDYFETVCWTLLSLTQFCEEKQLMFETFRQKIDVFEKCNTQLCFQQIALFASLSKNPSLLPSREFIIRIIEKSFLPQQSNIIQIQEAMVSLLDNFMRQKQQNRLRFEQENDKQLAGLYFSFIHYNLENVAFPKERKINLIYLLSTLINSVDENILTTMFDNPNAMKLISEIFYNSQFETWNTKKASINCLLTMLVNSTVRPFLLKRISSEDLLEFCYNSLLLPDPDIQKQLVSAIISICCQEPKRFTKQFTTRNMGLVIKKLQYEEAKNGVVDQDLKISSHVTCLVEFLKNLERQTGHNQQRPEYHGHEDIEI